MKELKQTYFLNGADRFQLYFDSLSRKKTGVGNIIRAEIIVDGEVPEAKLKELAGGEVFGFLSAIYPSRKWYSPVFSWKLKADAARTIFFFHRQQNAREFVRQLLRKDCSFEDCPVSVDVVYSLTQTHILVSANHALFDYAGMENLIACISGNKNDLVLQKPLPRSESLFRKIAGTVSSTIFMARNSSLNIRRLLKTENRASASLTHVELNQEETETMMRRSQEEIKTNNLSFFLGASACALSEMQSQLSDKRGDYFIAVPVNRRQASHKDVLLSNYLSFIFFRAKNEDVHTVKDTAQLFLRQMISQARNGMTDKFEMLLDIFRFLPRVIYRAFLELPSNGHSTTFAFSLLENSVLENQSFMGLPVLNVTHYPPVISPPGLNLVFTFFNGRLKIICSFDESRISSDDVALLLDRIRKSLVS